MEGALDPFTSHGVLRGGGLPFLGTAAMYLYDLNRKVVGGLFGYGGRGVFDIVQAITFIGPTLSPARAAPPSNWALQGSRGILHPASTDYGLPRRTMGTEA